MRDGADLRYEICDHLFTCDMDDQGIVRRTALGFVDLLYRLRVSRIGTEAIHGLCRHTDDLAFLQGTGGI